jgi:DNA-directed RNA polymerase delta subunit
LKHYTIPKETKEYFGMSAQQALEEQGRLNTEILQDEQHPALTNYHMQHRDFVEHGRMIATVIANAEAETQESEQQKIIDNLLLKGI